MASIPTPLTNPAGPGFRSASLTSNEFGMSHELNGAAIVTVRTVGQAWNISVQYNTMTQEQFAPLDEFLSTLNGNMNSFQILLPQYRHPKGGSIGAIPSSCRPSGTFAAGINTIRLANFTSIPNHTRVGVGSLIKFDNSPKVYKIQSITLSGAEATIVLNGGLYAGLTTGTAPQLSGVEFTCKLTSPPTINTNSDGLVESFTLQMKETVI